LSELGQHAVLADLVWALWHGGEGVARANGAFAAV
jgi:hypothetical protein